jgi:hypothetical protein
MGLAVALAGCGAASDIVRTADSAEQLITDAISSLNTQSEGWQTTLKGLSNKLVADGQDTLAHEVNDLLGRGAGVIGGQFSCRLDFIGVRMKQGLQEILAKLKGQPAPAKLPGLCNTVPESIDLTLEPQRRQTLTFYGYDLDVPNVSVKLGGSTMANNLVARLPYTMTVTLTSLQVSDAGKQITLASDRPVPLLPVAIGTVNITYVACGAVNQRCCKWEGAQCNGSLTCDGQACRTPAPVQCGDHNQPACTSGAACQAAFANIEGYCKRVSEVDSTQDNCRNSVVYWTALNGTVSILRGETKSFYVPTGREHPWVCPNDDPHGNTTCNSTLTNYLTVYRLAGSDQAEMQIHCKVVN